ncbi:MAG: hypothetical protein M0004_08595 [Actinomycetota bacterium]|nr:hypothetical protein [Actinomycetota bacterium]
MPHQRPPLRPVAWRAALALVLAALLAPLWAGASAFASTGAPSFPQPDWVDTVGPVALSSPATGVIDGVPVVAFGTESGYLYVVNARTGRNLAGWPQAVDIAPGVPTAVESSPTIAYLDGSNQPPTIIVGAGSTYVPDQQGGLIAFNANGTVRFRFATKIIFNEWSTTGPNIYHNGVFSTPAIGDVTGNGQQDIVFGSWDHDLYALTPQGKLVPGFPVNNLDTIWSSPALFHLRGTSDQEDIFIGGDASGRGGCHGGFISDYTYRNGGPHLSWQHCENQTIWSSPAIGVIDATGRPAVVVGTGFGEPPPYKSDSYKLFAFYADNGSAVPGWPVKTAGPAFGSPAIGTLPGSSTPSVVDTSWCTACTNPGGTSMVYAWSGSGHQLWSQKLPGGNDFSSPVLVDLTGQGVNDVVVGSSAGMYALNGANGDFLFGTSAGSPINTSSMLNSAAVFDVPGHGRGSGWHLFEACGGPRQVTSTGLLYDYPLPTKPAIAPAWAGWRDGPDHTGVADQTIPPATTTS